MARRRLVIVPRPETPRTRRRRIARENAKPQPAEHLAADQEWPDEPA